MLLDVPAAATHFLQWQVAHCRQPLAMMQLLGPAAATGREQQCAEAENIEANVLEQLRAERIRQNNAALAACGLEPVKAPACQKQARAPQITMLSRQSEAAQFVSCLINVVHVVQKQPRAPSSRKARPTRQSARLQHVAPEAQPSSP